MFKYFLILTLVIVGSQSLEGVVELTDDNFAEQVYGNSD